MIRDFERPELKRRFWQLFGSLSVTALAVAGVVALVRTVYLEYRFPVLQPVGQAVTAVVGLFLVLLTGGVIAAVVASAAAVRRRLDGWTAVQCAAIGNASAAVLGIPVLSLGLWDPWAWPIVLSLSAVLGCAAFTCVLAPIGRRGRPGSSGVMPREGRPHLLNMDASATDPFESAVSADEHGTVANAAQQWRIESVPWDDDRAAAMRAAMDAELGRRYAERVASATRQEMSRLVAALSVDPATIVATIIAVDATGRPVGHAALRDLTIEHGAAFAGSLEVKRVFVDPEARGTGLSRALMHTIELAAADAGAGRVILQTGDLQPEAITLYERLGYTRIPIFSPYQDIPYSVCFEKVVGD